MSWINCVCDCDYEIFTEFPNQIRRKSNKRIVKESLKNNGYIRCCLNGKIYLKHRIIALQFIPNPENKPFIDHIDHNRTNNSINNLRWVYQSENLKNKSSHFGNNYEFYDEINEDSMEVREYAGHQLEDYYYDDETDAFYFWNGLQFRKLNVCYNKKSYAFVIMYDVEHKQVKVLLSKFKKLYGLL